MTKKTYIGFGLFSCILLLSLGYKLSVKQTELEQGCGVSKALAAFSSYELVTNWKEYTKSDFNIAFEFPDSWEVNTMESQKIPYDDDEAIIYRQTFIGQEGYIILDVWLANGMNFEDWLSWYQKTRLPFPTDISNFSIAGNQAIAFIDDDKLGLLTVFFTDGVHIYRLHNVSNSNKLGLEVFRHMVDTISLSGSNTTATVFFVDLWNNAQTRFEKSGLVNPAVTNCCGRSSPSNPFPCCTSNGHDTGNCTWWVYYKYGYVPFTGDAWTWWGQVPDQPAWRRSTAPHIGTNIAWWNKLPSNNNYGHVAYAAWYSGGGTISIDQMFCYASTPCTVKTETISVTKPMGYIYSISTK